MLRWLINYIRSCFCKHDWELLEKTSVWDSTVAKYPIGTKWIYRCKKCGHSKKYKNFQE